MAYPGVYRAKAVSINGTKLAAFIPQVFGDVSVTVENFVGRLPATGQMGWVSFQGGNPEFPVWHGAGVGTSGGNTTVIEEVVTDTLWCGPDAPTDPTTELWWDTDAVIPDNAGVDHWNSAWGVTQKLAFVNASSVAVTAAATTLTTPVATTFTNGRRYRVIIYIRAEGAAALTTGGFTLYDGATSLNGVYGGNAHFTTDPPYGTAYGEWFVDGTGQSYAGFHVKVNTAAASTAYTSTNSACYIEDVGPVNRMSNATATGAFKIQTEPGVWKAIGGQGPPGIQGPAGTVPIWVGTQAQFAALGSYDANTFYYVTSL